MAFTKKAEYKQIFQNYAKLSAQSTENLIGREVSRIELSIDKAFAERTGKYLDPSTYDTAIQQLTNLMKRPMKEDTRIALQSRIYNYQKVKKDLQEAMSGARETPVGNIIQDFRNTLEDDRKQITNLTFSSPLAYIQAMKNSLKKVDDKGNVSGRIKELQDRNNEFYKENGYTNTQYNDAISQLNEQYKFYQSFIDNPDNRSNYGVALNTDKNGGMVSFDIVPVSDLQDKKNYKQLRGEANKDGFPVFIGIEKSPGENGEVYATLPGGIKLKTDVGSSYWDDAPKDLNVDNIFGSLHKALDFAPNNGDFVQVKQQNGQIDVYRYGGVKGDNGKLQKVSEEAMNQMGWWNGWKAQKDMDRLKTYTPDEFSMYNYLVENQNIDKNYLNQSNWEEGQRKLQEEQKITEMQSNLLYKGGKVLGQLGGAFGMAMKDYYTMPIKAFNYLLPKEDRSAIAEEAKFIGKGTFGGLGTTIGNIFKGITSGIKGAPEGTKTQEQQAQDIFKSSGNK